MEHYTTEQNPSHKLSIPISTLDPAKSFSSQPYTPSSTKSANPQRFDPIHPECLSPLALSSTNHSSSSKSQESSHKCHKGHNTGQLRVKVFHYLQEKNDALYHHISEEEPSSHSISTSANTPAFIDSAQLRSVSEGSGSWPSSRNEITRQNSEEANTPISRDNVAINDHSQFQATLLTSDSVNSTQVPADNHDALADNAEDNAGQATNTGNSDTGFLDSLEFILEKTPIISIFMSLICLALASGIAISVIEGKDTYTFLFIVLYVFLMYLLVEKTFKMFRACATATPTLPLLAKLEPFYNLLDGIAMLVIAITVNLKLSEVIDSYNAGLYPLIATFTLYCVFSRPPIKQKLTGIAKRGLYIAQFAVFISKAEGELSLSWGFVFCLGWIFLARLLYRLVQSIIKVYKAFMGLNILSSISKSAKITGMIGLILLGVDLGVLTMILSRSRELLDLTSSDMEELKFWLTICQYLNACLLFFTTIAGADLLEFILSAAEHFNPFDETVAVKAKELEYSKEETYVMRMSSTYYKVVEKSEGDSQESGDSQEKEDNTCYICCGNEADGVVLDCGHGGTCYGCLTDYITRKEECMECRKKVNRVLKIESEVVKDKLFKGEEICSIVRK